MEIINKLTFDMAAAGMPPYIDAVQGDTLTRKVEVTLMTRGQVFDPSGGFVSVSVAFKKPDGTAGWYDTLPDGSSAATVISDGVYQVSLAPEMLTVHGSVYALFRFDLDGQTISTFPFVVRVAENPSFNSTKSENYYNVQTWDSVNASFDEIFDQLAKVDGAVEAEKNRAVAKEAELEELFTLPTEEAVAKWLDEHPEATTTVLDRSLTIDKMVVGTLGYVTPEMFGAIGDGKTDDTQAIQNAINSLGAGSVLKFTKEKTYKLNSGISIVGKKRIKIANGKFDSTDNKSGYGFAINDSENVTFEGCTFVKGWQIILLHTCSDVFVDRCTFIETHYGIIQQNGYVSNNVNITNNRAFNAADDFIECNCESDAPSENWVVTGNIYKRDLTDIATEKTECRFLGATMCSNIIIANNVIEGAQGDSAIHFENVGNNAIIANNIIKNCNGYGYIAIYTSRRVLITDNIFANETMLDDVPFVFATYSNAATDRDDESKIVITGNLFNGNKTQSDPLTLYALDDTINVYNNVFNDIGVMFNNCQMKNIIFRSNVVHCTKFLNFDGTSGTAYAYDSVFSNNKINGDTDITFNSNGIPCKRLNINNNEFYGNVSIQHTQDCIFHDNFFGENYTLAFDPNGYYAKRMFAYNNFAVGVGKLPDMERIS